MKIESKKTFLDFDKNSRELYELIADKISVLGKKPASVDLFIFAMAFGFYNGNKVSKIEKSGTGVRVEYLKPEHELLMCAMQLAETGKTESLLDQEERFQLAEKYAEGGIRLLHEIAMQPGDFILDLAQQITSILEENSSQGD